MKRLHAARAGEAHRSRSSRPRAARAGVAHRGRSSRPHVARAGVAHRHQSSPLHASRAGVAALWCVVLGLVALSFEHPVLLVTALVVALAAGAAARVGRDVVRCLAWGLPFGVVIALVNAIVVRDGVTVVFRGGRVPVLGRLDITAEALAYGGVLGLRAITIIACAALLAAAVDPDELLRAVRRRSLRAGVTAALATHLIPVLARDARRLADAQRALTGGPPSGAARLGVLRAVTSGALDRATDVAATLEVRGFGAGGRPVRRRRPLSRHDLAFGVSALALVALAVSIWAGGWEGFEAYPRTVAPVDAGLLVLCAALGVVALLPFADRRGVGR
jgi:energy-coupling factor transport system permease protein